MPRQRVLSGKNAGVFISANGTSNGLVWQNSNGIRAWDASNLKQGAVYNSGNVKTDDSAQTPCQTPTFSLPIVSGGKAYFTCYQAPAQTGVSTTTNNGTTTTTTFSVPADNRPGYLWVYGAPPVAAGAPTQIPLNVAAQADSDSQITVTWSDPDFGNVPVWVKLQRSGNTFTGSASADGINWTQISTKDIGMTGAVTAGLAVTSKKETALNTAVFDSVSIR